MSWNDRSLDEERKDEILRRAIRGYERELARRGNTTVRVHLHEAVLDGLGIAESEYREIMEEY